MADPIMNTNASWLRQLWRSLRWYLISLVIIPIAFITVAFGKRFFSQRSTSIEFWMVTSSGLVRDLDFDRALQNLPVLTNDRLAWIQRAVRGLMVELPATELPHATIQLENERRDISGQPVDHFLFEWLNVNYEDRFGAPSGSLRAVRVHPAAASPPEGSNGIRVMIAAEPDGRIAVTTTLEFSASSGASTIRVCRGTTLTRATTENAGDKYGESLVPIADEIALCVLVALTERVTDNPTSLQRLLGDLFLIGDDDRLLHMIHGIERYYAYATTRRTRPGYANDALREAVDQFHDAAAYDTDVGDTSYPLADYLLVHAATALASSPPQTATPRTSHALYGHVQRAFKAWPFSCARWSQALAFQAIGRTNDARQIWQAWQDGPPDSPCAAFEVGPRYKAYKTMAGDQIANSYRHSGNFAIAMRARCGQSATGGSKDAGGKGGFETDAGAASCEPSNVEHSPQGTIETGAFRFERAIDYLVIEGAAYDVAEVAPFYQAVLQLVDERVRPLHDAALEMLQDYQWIDSPDDPPARHDLTTAVKQFEEELASCRAGTDDCQALRRATQKFAATLAVLSRLRAEWHLSRAQNELDAERMQLCKELGRTVPECDPTDAGDAGAAAVGSVAVYREPIRQPSPGGAYIELHPPLVAQLDDMQARIASHEIPLRCRMLAGTARQPLEGLKEIYDGNQRLLRRSALRQPMAAVLGDCAVTLLSAAHAPELRMTERLAHIADAWAWNPPDPRDAFDLEMIIRRDSLMRTERSVGLALLHYATVWPAVDYFSRQVGVDATVMRKGAGEALTKAQAELSQARPWTTKEDSLMQLWDAGIGGDTMRKALGAIGTSLAREVQRRSGIDRSSLSCRDIVSLSACTGPVDPGLLAACSMSEATCILDESRRTYARWANSVTATSPAEADDVVRDGVRRTLAAREHLEGMAGVAMRSILQAFAEDIKGAPGSANPMSDPRVRLGVLRIAAILRSAPSFAMESAALSDLGPRAFEEMLLAADFEDPTGSNKIRNWTGVSSPAIVQLLHERKVHFKGTSPHEDVRNLNEAIAILDRRSERTCWDTTKEPQHRWVRRFFGHVLLNLWAYAPSSTLDLQRTEVHDLVREYDAWCAWGAKGGLPLVIDEEVLALSWLWQWDFRGEESDRGTVLSGDALGEYAAMRGDLRAGIAPEMRLRVADPEAQLMAVHAALRKHAATDALAAAKIAQQSFRARTLPVVDAYSDALVGDAQMLAASLSNKFEDYLNAVRTYRGTERSGIQDIRLAAGLIEVLRPQEARSVLSQHPRCEKAKPLMAIALWQSGERERALALAKTTSVLFADLNLDTEDPGCYGEAKGPVFLGEKASVIAQTLLRQLATPKQ